MQYSYSYGVGLIVRSFLLTLCLHFSQWILSSGQTCISTEDSPDGTCSKSESCMTDYREEECHILINPVILPPPLPPDITRCPVFGLTDYGRCIPESSVNINEAILRESNMSVTVNLYSINVQSFAMVIAWNHVYNPTEGYEVRIKEDGKVRECYCIRNRSRRSFYVDDRTPFNYLMDKKLDIEILLLSTNLPEDIIKTSFSSEWPSSCLDINYNETTCGLPVYHPPGDVNVYRHLTTPQTVTLDINWNYTTEFNDPRVYYIQIQEVNNSLDGFYQTFVTNNTKSVQISQLNSSLKYTVKIQAFVQCSGLANWTLYFDGIIALGCGYWSRLLKPSLLIPFSSSSLPSLPTSTIPTSAPAILLIVVVYLTYGFIVIVIFFLTITFAIYSTQSKKNDISASITGYVPQEDGVERGIQNLAISQVLDFVHVKITEDTERCNSESLKVIEDTERSSESFKVTEDKEKCSSESFKDTRVEL